MKKLKNMLSVKTCEIKPGRKYQRVFYIDVGGVPVEEIEEYMMKIIEPIKENRDEKFFFEDFFIPIRGGGNTDIKIFEMEDGENVSSIILPKPKVGAIRDLS